MSTLLHQVYQSGQQIRIDRLRDSVHEGLVRALQQKLCELGLLDPQISGDRATPFRPIRPDDGKAGPETQTGIQAFRWRTRQPQEEATLGPSFFKRLAESEPDVLFPMQLLPTPRDTQQAVFAKRILRYMKKKSYWIARSPYCFNIVYVEGADADGRPNIDQFNEWNDRRCVIRILPNGQPEMLVNDMATTEPGKFYTLNPFQPEGVARIAFGQYKAWRFGYHKGVQPALVQRDNVRLHRDGNRDTFRDSTDYIDVGYGFGINQHSTRFDFVPEYVNRFSAGCLVGRRYNYHLSFLHIIRHDFRFVHNPNYLFITTIINGDELMQEEPV